MAVRSRRDATALLSLALAVGLASPAFAPATSALAAESPMPVISRGVPAYTNDSCGGASAAGLANDDSYDTQWRACNQPSSGAPTYLAYDLSGVPAASRGQVLVAWYNDPTTRPYDHNYANEVGYDIPSTYALEGNAAPGGTLPSSGWVILATVTGNIYHSRQHSIDLTGYDWFRMRITASDGSSGNVGVYLNLDVHDASAGRQDSWIFYGDSITRDAMAHNSLSSSGGTGTWAQHINASNPAYYPAYEDGGIGGIVSGDGSRNINTWLGMFPGGHVAISYGTNDATKSVSATTFYNNYAVMVQAVLAAGKVPVIPKIPWGCTAAIQANAPALNQKIDALYAAYPAIVPGPDLWSYLQANQNLVSGDCVHPTDQGYIGMRQQWANAMLIRVYGTTPPPLKLAALKSSASGASAVVSWLTNNVADSRVDYGTTNAYGSFATSASLVNSHSLSLTGLAGGTTYHYQVTSVDAYGQTATSADGTFTIGSANFSLQVSAAADRSASSALQGQTVAGTIYVFTSPASGVTRVRFWLDNPQMSGTPRQTEGAAPWDFAGTAANGTANPTNTTTIPNGSHTITAAVDKSAGGTDMLSSTFTVGNP